MCKELLCVCVCVFRCCGVRDVTHLQSGERPGWPDALCTSGRAGGRHSDRPRRSFPGKTVNMNNNYI